MSTFIENIHKIDFTAYDIHIDYPPAWELNSKIYNIRNI